MEGGLCRLGTCKFNDKTKCLYIDIIEQLTEENFPH